MRPLPAFVLWVVLLGISGLGGWMYAHRPAARTQPPSASAEFVYSLRCMHADTTPRLTILPEYTDLECTAKAPAKPENAQ